ncbi:hypothetical protein DK842_14890 [Chromobacterium phragmitis]|nr:YiaA/YiaB family inner membrane protein [Chromobacterium phragmitis]AXE31065.1 hypothetical protein DK842_14890 [Chromobacterium phragmitis]AXE36451.1 hypothetical protein DK843_20420 [Chromobacterium phragmitis]
MPDFACCWARLESERWKSWGAAKFGGWRPGGLYSFAFVAASWGAQLAGAVVYMAGLWNSAMQLNEKDCCFTILMYGSLAAVSLQKNARDLGALREEGAPMVDAGWRRPPAHWCQRVSCGNRR